jgi:hypothetical protein
LKLTSYLTDRETVAGFRRIANKSWKYFAPPKAFSKSDFLQQLSAICMSRRQRNTFIAKDAGTCWLQRALSIKRRAAKLQAEEPPHETR